MPPLPVPRNLPFQVFGIQSSTLMSDSLLGFMVAFTRQNAGSLVRVAPAGVARSPAGTSSAPVKLVSAMVMPASEAQFAAKGRRAWNVPSELPTHAATETTEEAATSKGKDGK